MGSLVEVTLFEVEEGMFSKSWVPQPDKPLIRDLTTGVLYGEDEHFAEISSYRSGEVRDDLPMEVRRDLREYARHRGKVRACRVVWIGSGDTRYPQTSLVIEDA
ncbi:MAG: hypothetical protein R3A48_16750 [Polyangiales bacterium]